MVGQLRSCASCDALFVSHYIFEIKCEACLEKTRLKMQEVLRALEREREEDEEEDWGYPGNGPGPSPWR